MNQGTYNEIQLINIVLEEMEKSISTVNVKFCFIESAPNT
jgi:hypothetical protein